MHSVWMSCLSFTCPTDLKSYPACWQSSSVALLDTTTLTPKISSVRESICERIQTPFAQPTASNVSIRENKRAWQHMSPHVSLQSSGFLVWNLASTAPTFKVELNHTQHSSLCSSSFCTTTTVHVFLLVVFTATFFRIWPRCKSAMDFMLTFGNICCLRPVLCAYVEM